jgi:RNase P subunit RPR2
MYEDSLCGSCQQPGHLAYDQFNTGEFEAKVITCLGCEARERYADDEKLAHGEKLYVHNHIDDDRMGGA